MLNAEELKAYIQTKFSEHACLSPNEVFGADLTLAAIITRSERMTNSVDLMEAFARTSNALRKEHGIRVRLPALALDTPISKVLEAFLQEAQRQQEGRAA
ncbi:hypothetical protein [Hyalangium rubrum]|uniref:Uncharacterized protein n=1 Tax=Hyalangium rubrum TaxID=3103134 RepID=A0ABU5H1Q7_9BACT|nr:hypothetical protein [Hyalangium sp. s54d21]MDY7227236.1 hypothetical protein [Hyalangium sp. s54d21]